MNTVLQSSLTALIVLACMPVASADENGKTKGVGNDCLHFRSTFDWRALDETHLVIWGSGRSGAYLLEVTTPLHSLRYANTLGFIDGNRDGRLCPFGGDAVAINEAGYPQRASVISMSRLDAESIAKLEEKYKTSLTRQTGKKKIPKEPEGAATE